VRYGGLWSGVATLKSANRGGERRYEIDCPVTVQIHDRSNGHALEKGRLRDIGLRTIRCFLGRAIETGARVTLHVHFSHPSGKTTTLVLKGTVERAQQAPPYEITVRFQGGARFLRDRLGDLLEGLE
jgi:hypothetical protein